MKTFVSDDYLLNNEVAKKLYAYAKKMPIIDYHCHLSPKEIYEDYKFKNITEAWLGGDHYKWRLLRSAGVDEKYITGDGDDKEKFSVWAKTLARAIGNPLFEWSHLELKNYFGFDKVLNEDTYQEVWDLCNEKLSNLTARKLIELSNVEVICTTDDPIDDLKYHKLMAEDETLKVKVLPAWRPDKIVEIGKDTYLDYLKQLEEVSEIKIDSFKTLKVALLKRLDYFETNNCKVSDHGFGYVPYALTNEEEVEEIFKKKLNNEVLSVEEIDKYRYLLLNYLGKQYHKRDWVMQLHYGVKRDNSTRLFKMLNVDCGGDNIGDISPYGNLSNFLNGLDINDELPKTIIYSLNPSDNTSIDTIIASFQKGPIVSKVQHGSAWWFNDNYDGMKDQLRSLAAQGYLNGFVGMLTDSRSFLSYARHEYFRRVLCSFVSELVLEGRFPNDEKILKEIIENISYLNVKEYFKF